MTLKDEDGIPITWVDEVYHSDYENEPIGGGNPYYCCIHCKRSDPEINGRLEKHSEWCKYRIAKESGKPYKPFEED